MSLRDYEFWVTDSVTFKSQNENPVAKENRERTMKLIDDIFGCLRGDVLDVGSRNVFTKILEDRYKIQIDSTEGDLDEVFNCPKQKYDFIHYNNVIEHQFNPLFTLLEIKKRLKKDGILILGTPVKPKWITSATCHFHEFDERAFYHLIARAGFKELVSDRFYHHICLIGIRLLLGSFYKKQYVGILKSSKS